MSESFLHYLWKYQYFHKEELATTEGEPLRIFSAGVYNTDAGPDFSHARIQVGDMQWVGNIEIHIQGEDWDRHRHSTDEAYENVVLHVIWGNPKTIARRDGSIIPTLVLRERVNERLIFGYRKLINSFENVPCAQQLSGIPDIIRISALDNALSIRLEHRAREVLAHLEKNKGDWDETTYQLLARNFGFKINSEPFAQLAHLVPLRIIQKHADKPQVVEAILYGAGGFLDDACHDEYYNLLRREFNVIRQKYPSLERSLHKMQWKFLRLRPSNFPTLRIAQFAALLREKGNIFTSLLECDTRTSLVKFFSNEPSAYWETHYHFRKKVNAVPGLGHDSIHTLSLNTVVPLLAAYAIARDDYSYMERALTLLHELPAESNRIVREWSLLSLRSKSAYESQALIELYNNFCSKRRCLDCSIGAYLLKPPV
jgi:hypothetical protein